MITCVVGSGGKTTLIHKMANTFRNEGKRVLVTTTTHMCIEPDTLVTDDANQIIASLEKNGYAFVGTACEDSNKIADCSNISGTSTSQIPDKITALSPETFQKVVPYADEVLIEADGSKQLPLKMPNDNEPVLVPGTDRVVVVSSLFALCKPVKEVVHRFLLALPVLSIDENALINANHIQTLLRKGYIEPLMKQGYNPEIQITHDGSLYHRALAALLQANMDVSLINEDWFAKKPNLFICGAGHVAKELADISAHLDFRIQVIDSRIEFANKDRFPYAEQVICDSFENLPNYLEDNSFYVVVTPGHQDDYLCVKQILNSPYAYLGMIGSHKKVEATRQRLLEDGFSKNQIDSIYAPVGLPIGAVTPGEIAISILAQIIEIKNKRSSSSISAALQNTKETGTLCIIIEKTGSAPRGVGSMMLVTKNGQIDTIGGGAVEKQVIEDARKITNPCIKEYYLDSREASNLGMICGGMNKVLFIPLD